MLGWVYNLLWATEDKDSVLAEKVPVCTGPARNIFISPEDLKLKKVSLKSVEVVESLRQSALLSSILKVKGGLNKVKTRPPIKLFEPRHPVLAELLKKVTRVA